MTEATAMESGGSPGVRLDVLARLFERIEDLPRDQQLLLLKQLLGGRMTTRLFQLILDLSEEEKERLLEQWGAPREVELPSTTLTLDEDEALIRRIPRSSCRLRAICVVQATTFDGVVTDISPTGMFIQSPRSPAPGTPIRVSVRLPGAERAMILSGTVQRGEDSGFAVRLQGLAPEHEQAIRRFIDEAP